MHLVENGSRFASPANGEASQTPGHTTISSDAQGSSTSWRPAQCAKRSGQGSRRLISLVVSLEGPALGALRR